MRYLILILLNFLLFVVAPVQAEEVTTAVVKEGVRAAFEEFERQMISKYFEEHPGYYHEHENDDGDGDSNTDGKGKKSRKGKDKGLPPGIQKKLERGGTLPPGIAKRYLPDDLISQLPPPPAGYERTIIGTDVLLVEIDTGKIADIITDAILGE